MDPLQELLQEKKIVPVQPEKAIANFPAEDGPRQSPDYASLIRPTKVQLTVSSGVHVPAEAAGMLKPLLSDLTFKNPAHAQAMKYGRTLPDEFLFGYRPGALGGVELPRGDLRGILNYFHTRRITVDLRDQTAAPAMGLDIEANAGLPDDLERAVSLLSGKRSGLIVGGDGVRDRAIVSHLAAFHGLRTLIVCQRSWQLYVWRNCLTEQTSLTDRDIGIFGDGRRILDRPVTVALQRSLKPEIESFMDTIGFLAVDGCGYAGMPLFFDIVWRMRARFMIGLTGHEPRQDGLEKLMRAFMGDVVVQLPRVWKAGATRALHVRATGFSSQAETYGKVMEELCGDAERTQSVAMDILALSSDKKAGVVVVGTRLEQLEGIRLFLENQYRVAEVINGQTGQNMMAEIIRGFVDRKIQVVLTTNMSLDALPPDCATGIVVAAPFQKRETAAAMVRLMRDGAVVQDYRDEHPMLIVGLKKRVRFYGRFGVF